MFDGVKCGQEEVAIIFRLTSSLIMVTVGFFDDTYFRVIPLTSNSGEKSKLFSWNLQPKMVKMLVVTSECILGCVGGVDTRWQIKNPLVEMLSEADPSVC